jgi:hypothetical protein
MNYKCTHCGWEGEWEKTIRYPSPDGYATECPLCNYLCCELSYTRVPPTEPGWYWWRDDKILKAEPLEVTHEIWDTSTNGEDNWGSGLYANTKDGLKDIDFIGGEWSERIEPPE